jgi:hypothetical protein
MIKRCIHFFSDPAKLSGLNAVFISIIICLNIVFQAFCIPTTWALIVLVICFANTIAYPILQKTKLQPIISFINGVSCFTFLYCMLFLEQMNIYGIIFFFTGIGLAVYIPHFFIIQLLFANVFRPKYLSSRKYFLLAFTLCIVCVFLVDLQFKKALLCIEQFKKSNYTKLQKNYMTEKILGMHFIYHTRFCEYDGWRPPKHEPILILGLWLNQRKDPLDVDLKTRLHLYKTFFPENKYKFDCACALESQGVYDSDSIWE